MPDVIGSASYELVVNLDKFDAQLKAAEAKLAATGSRFSGQSAAEINARIRTAQANRIATAESIAASQGIVRASSAEGLARLEARGAALAQAAAVESVAKTIDRSAGTATKAVVATTRLNDASKIQTALLRTGASQIASSTLGMSRFSSAAGGLAVALPGIGFGIIGLVTAFELLNAGVRHFTGASIIDHLTGEAAAHDRVTKAVREQGEALENVARIRREGVTQATAKLLEFETLQQDLANKIARRDEARARGLPRVGGDEALLGLVVGDELKQFDTDIDQIAKRAIDLELTLSQLLQLQSLSPDLSGQKAFAEELEKQKKAAGTATTALASYEAAIDSALRLQSELASAQSDLQAILNAPNPQLERLRLEQLQLQQLENKMGDAFGEKNQARLKEVGRLIDAMTAKQDIAAQSAALLGAEIAHAYGDLADEEIKKLTASLSKLPTEQRLKIAIILPNLQEIESVFKRFIAALQAGASVEIALRLSATGAFPGQSVAPTQRVLPGETPAQAVARARRGAALGETETTSDAARKIIDDANEVWNSINENAAGPLGAVADSAKKAGTELSYLQRVLMAVSDGVITLTEATELQLSDAQVVTLELEFARNQEANAAFRTRIALQELTRVFPGLDAEGIKLGVTLVAIRKYCDELGISLEQFMQRANMAILDTARSAIEQMLGGPTRESLQQELKLKQLQREKIVLEGQGADASRVDNSGKPGEPLASAADRRLKTINDQITAQQRLMDLRSNEIDQLRIKAQLADETIRTDRDLINAYTWLFGVVKNLSGAVQDATTFLQDFAGMGAIPQAAGGMPYVPRDMPVMVHRGERIITAAENRQLGAGTAAPIFNQTFNVGGDPNRETIVMLAREVEQANDRSLRRWRGNVLGGRGTN